MKSLTFMFASAMMLASALANSLSIVPPPVVPVAPRVILVGDSTMATRTGYGDALCKRFIEAVTCINLARGGRSTKSFWFEGLWDNALTIMKKEPLRTTYVLIQFGHNDQPGKMERSTELEAEFPRNLHTYIDQTRAAGAIPVLVTPLTRRTFKNGELQGDLRPWAETTLRVARERMVQVIDLNALSFAAVAKMGSAEADTLAEEPPPKGELPPGVKTRFDYTHLGEKGAALFSDIMAKAFRESVPALAAALR